MLFDLLNTDQISSYLNSGSSIVMDFYAEWCPPCKKFLPVFEQVSAMQKYRDVVFLKVNIDDFPELAGDYKVASIPTIIFLKNKDYKNPKKIMGYKEEEHFIFEIDNYFF